jgi:hypothetical protein
MGVVIMSTVPYRLLGRLEGRAIRPSKPEGAHSYLTGQALAEILSQADSTLTAGLPGWSGSAGAGIV